MRLIDADTLRGDLVSADCYGCKDNDGNLRTGCFPLCPTGDFLVRLDTAPTIDPEDLRPYGKWLHTTERMICHDEDCVKCSVCNEIWITNEDAELFDWKYCPHCGARMEAQK